MRPSRSAGFQRPFVVGRYLSSPDYDSDSGDAAGTGAAPDGDGSPPPPDGAQGDDDSTGATPAPPATSSSPAGTTSVGEEDGTAGEGGEEPSRIKQLSDEAAKYRKRAKAAEDSVEQAQKIIAELRIENAYIRHAIPVVDDLDAGRKLADFAGVTIDENGNVEGMTEAVNSLLRNYPYLERQPDTRPMAAPGSGGSPVNGRRTGDAASPAVLERRYPALRNRRPSVSTSCEADRASDSLS